ncbi:hypothetical protein IMZ48_06600 [Candidatus Bathyarchaeota archaeon]|nr:hypothetical protein [Candidatus Bathyarchaeota archaeon]
MDVKTVPFTPFTDQKAGTYVISAPPVPLVFALVPTPTGLGLGFGDNDSQQLC